MASSLAASLLSVVLVVVVVALLPSSPPWVVLAADADDGTTHLHFFMHDVVAGTNPTAVQVVKGPAAAAGSSSSAIVPGMAFGDTTVIDDALTETSSPASAAVGRAQGFYMLSSQSGIALMVCANLLLTGGGDYNGSTIAVVGRDDVAADVRELAVVGGTGKFRMATGYVLWKTTSLSGPNAVIELDVHVKTATGAATGTGGGTAIDGGGGSIATAAAAAKRRAGAGWVSACVVAVVVAVVGSGVL